MTTQDQLKDDLDFIASTVRRNDRSGGLPVLYVFWALAIAIDFTLADFAPRIVGDDYHPSLAEFLEQFFNRAEHCG